MSRVSTVTLVTGTWWVKVMRTALLSLSRTLEGPETMVEVVFLQGILQSDSTVPLMMPPIYKSEKRWIYRIRDIETYLKC